MMNELRQDPTSGLWVIIASERGHRPCVLRPAAQALTDRLPVLRFDPDCPFCPGHEHRLPGIIAEIRMPDPPGWSVRVVPNKFPAVQADRKTEIVGLATQHRLLDGYGFHEVIIESPRHDADLAELSDVEIDAVIAMYCDRSRQLRISRLSKPSYCSAITDQGAAPHCGIHMRKSSHLRSCRRGWRA